jgi:MFS family permease
MATPQRPWFTPGVRGIGFASLLADAGHEISTALLPSLLTSILGAPAAALGLIEGIADALSGAAKFIGGALADDPGRRQSIAVGGYTLTAVLSALIGLATAAWQVAILRAGAWTSRGVRVPARNALLADAVDRTAYGRAYGFERSMDNLGAVVGPILALILVGLVGIRGAILLSVIPGLLAAGAIVYAIHHLERPPAKRASAIKITVRPLMQGPLGRLFLGIGAFELGNMAATFMILRATELLQPSRGIDGAAQLGIALYVLYNIAGAVSSLPAGRTADALGMRPLLIAGALLFVASYIAFAVSGPDVLTLGIAFMFAGIGIGCVETAQNGVVASYAPRELRGSSFGLLAAIQSIGDFGASVIAGLLWTVLGAPAAFAYGTAAVLVSVGVFITQRSPDRGG